MTNPYDDWRGGWLNRDLAGFVGGMAGWIAEAGRLPLSRDEHKIWDVVFPAHGIWDGGEANCRRT